jgi:hypothetical protein
MLNSEQNPEECDATDDDSSNTARLIKKIIFAPLQARLSSRCKSGRKVRTAQSNAPVKSRVPILLDRIGNRECHRK